MSRQEQDREDLLREATALVERAEIRLPDEPEPVVVGFRRNGAFSVYFGADPVYQFNAEGQLRRSFLDDRLVKAEHGRLYWLERQRVGGRSNLIRSGFSADDVDKLMRQLTDRLGNLAVAIRQQDLQLHGQHPGSADVLGRVLVWLESALPSISIANSPRAGSAD